MIPSIGPPTRQLHTYYYHRLHLVEQSARYSNKMQKSLRLMNLRLDVVLSDITGPSGMAIIEAILAGEREPAYLASLVSRQTKRSRQEIDDALHGWWREDRTADAAPLRVAGLSGFLSSL